MEMKIETIVQEIIKPSSPTANHRRTVDLSVYDNSMPPIYVVVFLFYSADQQDKSNISQENTSQELKSSLSETLTRFYPFAGRIRGLYIDCNDEGAVFVEARSSYLLSDFLASPDFLALQKFLPLDTVVNPYEASATWPLLLVKATYFGCGGLAIGICISHKVADAASITTFIRTWASLARGDDGDAMANPEFTASRFFPSASCTLQVKRPKFAELHRKIFVTKRFVFDASGITQLRAKAASVQVAEPTRVEAVTALLWKCALASLNSTSEKFLTKMFVQPRNLRPAIPSLLSENIIGNILYSSMFLKKDQQGEVEIQEMVRELRTMKEEFKGMIQDGGGPPSTVIMKTVSSMLNSFSQLNCEIVDKYAASSWCKFPLYEVASFRWGSPVWVTGIVAPVLESKTIILVDAKDGKGIEAWVTLPQQDMSMFEQNPELHMFASPKPCVTI